MEIKEIVEETSRPASFEPRTLLGEKLFELRAKIVSSGERLFDWEELEKEIADRRGGQE